MTEPRRLQTALPMSPTSKNDGSHLWNGDTLSSLLAETAGRTPDAPAIITTGETIEYAALAARVETLAKAFTELGLRPGDRIGLQLPNIPEFLVAYLAAARLGAVTSTRPFERLHRSMTDAGSPRLSAVRISAGSRRERPPGRRLSSSRLARKRARPAI